MKRLRTVIASLAVALGIAGAVTYGMPLHAQEDDQSTLGRLISRALSTPEQRVRIGSIDGALSSNATINDIRIADRDGDYLVIERARIVWSRLALLRGRLLVNELEVDGLQYLRAPLPSDAPPVDDAPILPELPVKVVVEKFALNSLALGEPVLGVPARLAANGSLELGDPAEGLELQLDARRLDAPGTFRANLDFVPQGEQLAVDLDFNEPEGGLAARAMNIPGLPPVRLNVQGKGPLDNFNATLAFDAGENIGANGKAVLLRNGQIRRLNVDVDARIAGLVPEAAAAVVPGTTELVGAIVFGDDGGYAFEEFRINSQVARLQIGGFITATRDLDLRLTAEALPTDGTRTRAGDAEIGKLALDMAVTGNIASPRLNGTLDAAEVRLPQGALDSLSARIAMDPVPGSTNRFLLGAEAQARGLALADPALARAVGDRFDLTARGLLDEERILTVEEARMSIPTASVTFDGRVGQTLVDARVNARVPALAPFSDLAGRSLGGAANANLRLTGNPARTVDIVVDARLADLATGVPQLDGLLGRDVAMTGTVQRIPAGWQMNGLRLDGATLDAVVDGSYTNEAVDVALKAALSDLAQVEERLSGRANVEARVTGRSDRPDLAATAELLDASALGRPIPRLAATVKATNITGDLDARARIDGTIAGEPAQGVGRVQRLAGGGWNVEGLDLDIGSVAVEGNVRLDAESRAAGRLAVRAGDLDDISPLLLTRLGGRLDADITLDTPEGRQNAVIKASGERLAYDTNTVSDFTADATITDLYGRPVLDGLIEASAINAGGQRLEAVRLAAKGTPEGSDLDISARAQGFQLAGQARLVPGDPNRLDIASFSAVRGGRRIALAGPGSIAFADGGVDLRNIVVAVERGRIALSGRAGSTLDLNVDVTALPLSAAEIFVPGLGLQGTLGAEARITGTTAAPEGTYNVRVQGFQLPATRSAGLPAITANAQGRLSGGRTTVDARITAGNAINLNVTGSAPLGGEGALDLTARGRADVAVANATLSQSGQRATGTANVDVRVGGTIAAPDIRGTINLAGGTFTDQLRGVNLTGINARVAANGQVVTIERLTAQTPNGGTISGQGRITVNPAAGFPADIRITARRAQLVSNPTVTAAADLDLQISGPVTTAPRIGGRVTIVSMDVTLPDRLAATLQPLPETRHVNPTETTRRRLAIEARRNARASGSAAPFAATLDLTIAAPNRIFVRGRGLNAELGGDLQLTGTTNDPVAIGAFELRRGRFDVLGQRIDFTRGRLTFSGELSPELDFLAETTAGDVTAQVLVQGSASEPEFTFTSSPELPQDEVLSRLLFGRAAGDLSAGQALQLASAVAQFSGGGSGAFDDIRKSLGVDSLDISVGQGGGVAVGVSNYISDNISVGVRGGARPEDTGVTVNIDITRNLKAQAEAGADGRASVGAAVEWEY